MIESKEFAERLSGFDLCSFNSINKQARIIYLHIPKTAGKSFTKLANSNYGDNASLTTRKGFPQGWVDAVLVGGHKRYPVYEQMRGERMFLAVVRSPVERAISRFNYYFESNYGSDEMKREGYDFDDMKRTILDSHYRVEFVDNFQCLYLSGKPNLQAVKKAFRRDTFIVGHFDNLDAWLNCVSDRLAWKHSQLPEMNVASNPEYMKAFMQDDELMDLLVSRNREDQALYEFIRSHGVYESRGADFDYSSFVA